MTTRHPLAIILALLAAPAALTQDLVCPEFFPGGQPPALVNPRGGMAPLAGTGAC